MASKFYQYVWDIKFNIPSRNISFRPYSLIEFRKKCDYFNSFIPTYKMKCKIEDRHLDYFRTLDKELKVTIKQYMFSGEDKNNLSDRELIFENTFAVYYDKEQIPNASNSYKVTSEKIGDISKDKYQNENPIKYNPVLLSFNLLLIDDLKMKTVIHNYVLGTEEEPVDPITAVKFVIDQNPFIKKCIIDKPDNNLKYTDLIVEPNELKDAIKMIQYRYGIYYKSLELFYDDGILYVLNKLEPNHSYQKDELTTISVRIDELANKVNIIDGSTIDVKNKFVKYERTTKIFKEDYESINSILKGDKFIYSNFSSVLNQGFGDNGETTFVSPLNEILKPRSGRNDIGVKKILDYDMLNNPFNMQSEMYEQSKGVPVVFTLTNVNCKHFSPNKHVKLSMDLPASKKLYSGIYNIAGAEFVYTTIQKPNVKFSTYGHVMLTLCNKQEGFDKDYEPKEDKK